MKRLISFIKRNKRVVLASLALVLLLLMLFSMIAPVVIMNNGSKLTEEAEAFYLLMFCFSSIALGVVAAVIITDLNDTVRKYEAIARQQNFKYDDE